MSIDRAPQISRWIFPVAPVPALLLGALVMRQTGVPSAVWLTNLAAGIVGVLLIVFAHAIPRPSTQITIAVLALAIIVLPFAFDGMSGVHRWISIGGFRLHAAAIVAPVILASIAATARRHTGLAIAIAVFAAIILALQPDAAQATSFAAACIPLLALDRERSRSTRIVGSLLLLLAAALAFARPDPLAPVPHVEGIFTLVASRGIVWATFGTVTLLLLPLSFFVAFARTRDRVAIALGIYIGMTIVAAFWGTFPVPVMGYGVSPILGYFLALASVSEV